jgi:hypothetical protein
MTLELTALRRPCSDVKNPPGRPRRTRTIFDHLIFAGGKSLSRITFLRKTSILPMKIRAKDREDEEKPHPIGIY